MKSRRNHFEETILQLTARLVVRFACLFFVVALFGCSLTPQHGSSYSRIERLEPLTVHFIDVGQGDSILIQAPLKSVLIDGGNRNDDAMNYLAALGVEKLDIVISTHPHADHIRGLIRVLETIPVGEVIDPGVVHTTQVFERYLITIDRLGIKFTEGRAGMTRDLGGVMMEIIHPVSPSRRHLNDASVVVKLTHGEVSFLLTGDAELDSEREMLSRGHDVSANILKVGHHGSKTSTSADFLKAVSPKTAVIMCGESNSYGHPHAEVIERLKKAEVNIYRTDRHGTVVINSDGKSYEVRVEKSNF